MLPGHLIGATGAGDVKLFAALGALLGPGRIATAFFYTALAGGVLAIFVALQRRRLRARLDGTARRSCRRRTASPGSKAHSRTTGLRYAPAIAVGTMLAALGL